MELLTQALSEFSPILLSALIILGASSGILAGLLGIGGGLILIPGLLFIFQAADFDFPNLMHLCIGTSLSIIIFTGASSAYAHWKKGAVDTRRTLYIGAGILFGAILGGILASTLTGQTMTLIFASLLIILALFMLINPERYPIPAAASGKTGNALAGIIIGAISTLMGIGGATLSVPYMNAGGLNIRRCVGTASALGIIIGVPATLSFIIMGWDAPDRPPFSLGYVNILTTLIIIPFSMLCAPLGANLAHKLPAPLLRKIFAGFLIIVALRLWMKILL